MGVKSVNNEFTSCLPPKRLFKAFILESQDLFPKLFPGRILSMSIADGNGGPGTIKHINFTQGRCVKYKLVEIDESKYWCKYRVVGGDVLGEKLEMVEYEVKFEKSGEGEGEGCVCKHTTHYHTKGTGVEVDDDIIEAGKDRSFASYKVVEDYLIANPSVCA